MGASEKQAQPSAHDPERAKDLDSDIYRYIAPVVGPDDGMYRDRLWPVRQYAGFSSPEDTNERYRYLIEHGSTGLSMAFDLPTQFGRDSDEEICDGEVGRTGVPMRSRSSDRMLRP